MIQSQEWHQDIHSQKVQVEEDKTGIEDGTG